MEQTSYIGHSILPSDRSHAIDASIVSLALVVRFFWLKEKSKSFISHAVKLIPFARSDGIHDSCKPTAVAGQ